MNVEPSIHSFDAFLPSKETVGMSALEDISELLKQDLVEEAIQEDDFHSSLVLNDQSWACFDFTVDSLEPTPIPSTQGGIQKQKVEGKRLSFSGNLVPSSPIVSALEASRLHASEVHSSLCADRVLSSAPPSLLSKPVRTRTAGSRDAIDDSCYIRPSKIARMVSNASLAPTKSSKLKTTASAKTAKPLENVPDGGSSTKTLSKHRFRTYQNDQWNDRYQELKAFKRENGHCLVPHNYIHKGSPALAQWVVSNISHIQRNCPPVKTSLIVLILPQKRQRFQYKQALQNKRTTITQERKQLLDDLDFVWDSHQVAWQEKFQSLLAFKEEHGHADVPSNHDDNKLSIWVKVMLRLLMSFLVLTLYLFAYT